MDFAGSGKATAEATWPAMFQAMCDTRSALDKLLVETRSMRADNAVIFGRVNDTLANLDSVLALMTNTLQALLTGMGMFRSEINGLTAELASRPRA